MAAVAYTKGLHELGDGLIEPGPAHSGGYAIAYVPDADALKMARWSARH